MRALPDLAETPLASRKVISMNGNEWAMSVDSVEESNQLQPADTLDDRGVTDALDEGLVTREGWSPGQGYGNTVAEQLRGETLDQRLAQEEPESFEEFEEDGEEHEVGDLRAGRLVAPDEGAHADEDAESFAYDVGIDGGAASAEEAAMHVIPDDEL